MKCKICKNREIETTDRRCYNCIGKAEVFIYPAFQSRNQIEDYGVITPEDEKEFYKNVFRSKV